MSRATLVSALVLGAAIALALVLNPSPEDHRQRIRTAIAERSPLARVLGVGPLTAFNSIYHPLGVASYTTVNGRVASVGAFGVVLVIQSENGL